MTPVPDGERVAALCDWSGVVAAATAMVATMRYVGVGYMRLPGKRCQRITEVVTGSYHRQPND
jgi:hypothetical protein